MKKLLVKTLVLLSCICQFTNTQAQALPKDSLELKQLTAMGYDFPKDLESSGFTVASNGTNKIVFSRDRDRLAIWRVFTRKKGLTQSQEYDLLKIINKVNTDLTYQVQISETTMSMILCDFGSYDPKTFAKLVRMIEKADTIYDTYPDLLKLIN